MKVGTQRRRFAAWLANRNAIVQKRLRLTYHRTNKRVNRLANGLLSLGLEKEDRVAFLFPNRQQIIEGYYPCFKTGPAAVPLNARFSIPEAIRLLISSKKRKSDESR